MQVKFLRASSGARIAYATVGSGPPFVMVPPWSSHLEAFWELDGYRRLSSGFATGHTVVMYDRWGTGLSERTRDDLSLRADVEVLDDVLSHLRLRRAALFGSSHGAPAALEYAAANPRRVSRLVLYSMETGHGPDDPRWTAFRDLLLADWEMGSFALGSVLLAGAEKEEISAFARLWRRCTSAEMAVGLQDAAIRHDSSVAMAAMRVPTLVVSRRDDRLISAETSREIATAIPDAELVLLDGEAHLPHEGDVDSLVAAVLAFLEPARRPSAGSPGPGGATERLTEREREVLDHLVAGATNRAIADRLVLSVRTVERHTLNIYAKLGVQGRAEAISAVLGRQPDTAR